MSIVTIQTGQKARQTNLKFIGFHQQHLFQIGSGLEGVKLLRMEPRGAALCGLWELTQQGRIFKEGLFGLQYIMPQLLEKERGEQ